jgi:hypothetical protein
MASSSCVRVRETRSAISSVLKQSTALDHGIVEGVADRPDRVERQVIVENLLESEARALPLRARIAVIDQLDIGAGFVTGQSPLQGVEDTLGAHATW